MPLRYLIEKEIKFSAGHQLYGLEEGHPCGYAHGHNYKVIVRLESQELDTTGFIVDFGILKQAIKSHLDHKVLNEVMGKKLNPTAENVARYIHELLCAVLFKMGADEDVKVTSVKVYETDSSMAEVTIDPTR